MAWGRRYRRRRNYRRYRRSRAERQRLVYPKATVESGKSQAWLVWRNWRSNYGSVASPLDGTTVGEIVQEPVSQYIGRIKVDWISAPVGLRFLVVYVPATNINFSSQPQSGPAQQLIPQAAWVNPTGIPTSLYEPNQHVIGYGMVTSEKKGFYFSRVRRLYSGDQVALLTYNHTEDEIDLEVQVSFMIR